MTQRERLDAAIAEDDESREYLTRLEALASEERMPTGDELAFGDRALPAGTDVTPGSRPAVPSPRMPSLPDLWTCPRCGARFVTANMWHGCGDYTVDGFFEGKPARLRELYDAWAALVGEFGPFDQVPTKSRIAFMVRVRFAGWRVSGRTGSSAASG